MLTLQYASLDWALQHALLKGDTNVFPRAFEYEAINHDWGDIRDHLRAQDVQRWAVRPHRTLLFPKGRVGFRPVTQLDPLDFILYSATVYEAGSAIEARRVPVTSDVVFSYRFSPDPTGRLFDPNTGYSQFLASCEVQARESSHVAVTDIADFYPRLYHHPLENALVAAGVEANHVSALMHLLRGWNSSESYGVPVGSRASGLLAEIAIADVDEALLANGVKFKRYNDDYRIFGASEAQVYRQLALLAEMLFTNHGLSLQQSKTRIVPSERFIERFLDDPVRQEIATLGERFERLATEIGLDSWYEPLDYANLTQEQQDEIDGMNLIGILTDQIQGDGDIDIPLVRFVLQRLGQVGDSTPADLLLDSASVLHPVFPDVIRYFQELSDLGAGVKQVIGARVLDLLEGSILSELEYHRMWILELFTKSTEWNNEDRFVRLLTAEQRPTARRKLILALGRAGHRHWFQGRRRTPFDEPPWVRRAVIAASSCLPADARRHWYRAIEPRLDPLERAVARWASQHPFYT